MALQGSLREMSVVDLIQHTCQDQKTALLTINRDGKQIQIFFKDGTIVHAAMGGIIGEKPIFEALSWEDGEFVLEVGTEAPIVSITRNWSSLLLEGAKQMDESSSSGGPLSPEKMINNTLVNFLMASKLYKEALVMDTAGTVMAACLENPPDQEMLTAIAAAIVNLGSRSVRLMNKGKFDYSIIQGENTSMIVMMVSPTMLIFGLCPGKPNPASMVEEIVRLSAELAEFVVSDELIHPA
jgi:predicted regulator of Ras-like GTPase activity (Roadblock/LC7/MglB family)